MTKRQLLELLDQLPSDDSQVAIAVMINDTEEMVISACYSQSEIVDIPAEYEDGSGQVGLGLILRQCTCNAEDIPLEIKEPILN